MYTKHLLLFLLLLLPFSANAFLPTFSVPEDHFHVFELPSDIEAEREYYGALSGFPHLYEVTISEPQTLKLQVFTPESDPTMRFSGIVVEVQESGRVREVVRFGLTENAWEPIDQPYTGETLLQGPIANTELAPGTYRIEVNTPENEGKYVMMMGTTKQGSGYFQRISDIWDVKEFYGHSYFSMLFISPIMAPLGIIVMLILFFYTWRYYQKTKRLQNSEFSE